MPLQRGTTALRTAAGIGECTAVLGRVRPVGPRYVTVLDGRAPATAGEVALTEPAMARLGAAVGGTVTTARRATVRTQWSVVVEFPAQLREQMLFAPTDRRPPADVGAAGRRVGWSPPPGARDWSDVLRLNRRAWS